MYGQITMPWLPTVVAGAKQAGLKYWPELRLLARIADHHWSQSGVVSVGPKDSMAVGSRCVVIPG